MKWMYRLVLWIALPAVWLRLWWRARNEPAYGVRRRERFGYVPTGVRSGCVWFHTVSAGETIAAAPTIETIARGQALPVLVTTMTPSGSEQVLERLGAHVDHCYAPYDFRFAVERFFDTVQPRLLVLMETELWPNMIAVARARQIPVLIVNARLSAGSARGYGRLGSLTRTMLGDLTAIVTQTESHAARFIDLGAAREIVSVNGNIKYDARLPDDHQGRVETLRQQLGWQGAPVVIAASTHPGEDAPVIDAFDELLCTHPQLRLILVPRHPVRADDVIELVKDAGMTLVRQSEEPWCESSPQVLVGDVMGTLQTLYGLADVAFVGGSLVERGGHNPIEPALCGIPVVFGPYHYNFQDIVGDLMQAGGLLQIGSGGELLDAWQALLADPEQCRSAGAAGQAVVAANRGAQARLTDRLRAEIRALSG